MDALDSLLVRGSQDLMTRLDKIDTQLKYQCLSNPGVVIGSSDASKVKIGSSTVYTNNGVFCSKTTAEVAFTATTHDITASTSAVKEACFLLSLAADGTPTLTMGTIASGAGTALWPECPSGKTPIGGVRVAVAAGSVSFDASTDLLSATHITDTYYNFGYYGARFDAAI